MPPHPSRWSPKRGKLRVLLRPTVSCFMDRILLDAKDVANYLRTSRQIRHQKKVHQSKHSAIRPTVERTSYPPLSQAISMHGSYILWWDSHAWQHDLIFDTCRPSDETGRAVNSPLRYLFTSKIGSTVVRVSPCLLFLALWHLAHSREIP